MKKFLVFLFIIAVGTAFAATETINWYVDGNTYDTTTCQTGGDILLPTAPTKYGYTFQGWSVYRPVEYIKSPGCAYIQTDYIPNQDTSIKTKVAFNSVANGEAKVFGSGQDYNSKAFELYLWDQKPSFNYNDYNYSSEISKRLTAGDTVVVDWNKNIINWSLNDVAQSQITRPYATFTSPYPARIFAITRPGNASGLNCGGTKIKMYYLQIYENDVLIHDFIPVLDTNDTPCMYDKVTNQCLYNTGTGDFTAGPIINQ